MIAFSLLLRKITNKGMHYKEEKHYFCTKIISTKMKKRFYTLVLSAFCASASTLHAQSMKDLFLHMPEAVCPTLSEYNRLEIVDNQKNGKPMQTRNRFDAVSEAKELTDEYLSLSLNANTEMTLKLLPLTENSDNPKVIAVVTTVVAEGKSDSSISFYSTDWQALDAAEFFESPINTTDTFRKLSLSKDEDTITSVASNGISIVVDGSASKPEEKSSSVILKWNGKRFE